MNNPTTGKMHRRGKGKILVSSFVTSTCVMSTMSLSSSCHSWVVRSLSSLDPTQVSPSCPWIMHLLTTRNPLRGRLHKPWQGFLMTEGFNMDPNLCWCLLLDLGNITSREKFLHFVTRTKNYELGSFFLPLSSLRMWAITSSNKPRSELQIRLGIHFVPPLHVSTWRRVLTRSLSFSVWQKTDKPSSHV